MGPTFKLRKDGKVKAAFAVYFGLTKEQFEVVKRLAESEGYASYREWLKKIAVKAIEDRISANR